MNSFVQLIHVPLPFQTIREDLYSYIKQTNCESTNWYVGTAADVESRLFFDHNLKMTDHFFVRNAISVDEAIAGARRLRRILDCEGRYYEPEANASYIYAFLPTFSSITGSSPFPYPNGALPDPVVNLRTVFDLALEDLDLLPPTDWSGSLATDAQYEAYFRTFVQWIRDRVEDDVGFVVESAHIDGIVETATYRGKPDRAESAMRTLDRVSFRFVRLIERLVKQGRFAELHAPFSQMCDL
ncbi:hypothetical protein [Nevskia ramosa]|uniref:hypothetical protein n=1 Tax=Nevskia ramosa TaxID=64002 RepID=UPI003D112819